MAMELLTSAVAQGHPDAQTRLGDYCQLGRNVEKDEKKAVELYALAAKQGNLHAQHELADCYRKGQGVAKDPKKAIELYTALRERPEFKDYPQAIDSRIAECRSMLALARRKSDVDVINLLGALPAPRALPASPPADQVQSSLPEDAKPQGASFLGKTSGA